MGGAVKQVAGNDISHSKNERPVQCNQGPNLGIGCQSSESFHIKGEVITRESRGHSNLTVVYDEGICRRAFEYAGHFR